MPEHGGVTYDATTFWCWSHPVPPSGRYGFLHQPVSCTNHVISTHVYFFPLSWFLAALAFVFRQIMLTELLGKKYLKRSNGVHRPGASVGPTGLAGQKCRWLTVISGTLSVPTPPGSEITAGSSSTGIGIETEPCFSSSPSSSSSPFLHALLFLLLSAPQREPAGRERAGLEGATWVARRCAVPPRGGGWGIPAFSLSL